MAEKERQEQTLSLRMSEESFQRLETIRELTSFKRGRNVSLSEVAKLLLEAAREDRFELVDLLRNPTESLLNIWKKLKAGIPLSRAEWTLTIYYAQQGMETAHGNPVSPQSQIAMLEAFAAVLKLLPKGTSERIAYYLGNLPREFRAQKNLQPTEELLLETVAELLQQMKTRPHLKPALTGRNLYVFLEEESQVGSEAIDKALRPYWRALWRLTARGHYFTHGKPIRPQFTEPMRYESIPVVREGEYELQCIGPYEFDGILTFPSSRGVTVWLSGYAEFSEFRAMLTAIDPDQEPHDDSWKWDGKRFYGYSRIDSNAVLPGGSYRFLFQAKGAGVSLSFSASEWKKLRKLFRRAWELPEVQAAWEVLSLEYGEL